MAPLSDFETLPHVFGQRPQHNPNYRSILQSAYSYILLRFLLMFPDEWQEASCPNWTAIQRWNQWAFVVYFADAEDFEVVFDETITDISKPYRFGWWPWVDRKTLLVSLISHLAILPPSCLKITNDRFTSLHCACLHWPIWGYNQWSVIALFGFNRYSLILCISSY